MRATAPTPTAHLTPHATSPSQLAVNDLGVRAEQAVKDATGSSVSITVDADEDEEGDEDDEDDEDDE